MGLLAQSRARVTALCSGALLLALLAASGSASAAPKPISGKLTKPGYTVIALAANGKASVVRASRGRFRLRPPAGRVTLHLRAPNGVYAGPIVVGSERRGRRAIVGVKAGARLGRVRVRRGYARPSRRLRGRWVDARRVARARNGVPIGAGVFGRVRSRPPRRALAGDRDLDGVPDPLDVDDDGDLVLDSLDRSPAARAAQVGNTFFQQTGFGLFLHQTAHANALDSGVRVFDDETIEATLRRFGNISIEILPGDFRELDCGGDNQDPPRPQGLRYCSAGGTGGIPVCCPPRDTDFPGSPGDPLGLDPDGDGFGRLSPTGQGAPGGRQIPFGPGASTDEIGTGDVLIQWVATGIPENQCPPDTGDPPSGCARYTSTLQYVFATPPALVSYDDGSDTRAVPYPVRGRPQAFDPPCPEPCPGPDPGAQGNGFPVRAGPDGQVRLTLTFWRPQRRPAPGEPGYVAPPDPQRPWDDPQTAWIDIGGLDYLASPQGGGPGCPENAYTVSAPLSTTPGLPGFMDTAPARAARTTNTFTYTLNLTQCLASRVISFNPGEEREFSFAARPPGASDSVGQVVSFRREDGNLIVRNETDPPESPTRGTEFRFDPDDAIAGPAGAPFSHGADFELRHDGTRSYPVAPGTYTVDELVPSGYELTGVVCDDPNSTNPSTGTTQPPRATFRVDADDRAVTCTFTNTQLPPP
jgi:hypothetical protein